MPGVKQRLTSMSTELKSAGEGLAKFSSKHATLDPQDQGKAMLDAAAMLQGQLIAARSQWSGLEKIYAMELSGFESGSPVQHNGIVRTLLFPHWRVH